MRLGCFMERIIKAIKAWWNGRDIYQEPNKGDSVFFLMPLNEKHWTSRFFHWIVSLFTNPERRSIFLAVLGFITFLIMLLKYFADTDANQDATNPQRDNREPDAQIHTGADQDKG